MSRTLPESSDFSKLYRTAEECASERHTDGSHSSRLELCDPQVVFDTVILDVLAGVLPALIDIMVSAYSLVCVKESRADMKHVLFPLIVSLIFPLTLTSI